MAIHRPTIAIEAGDQIALFADLEYDPARVPVKAVQGGVVFKHGDPQRLFLGPVRLDAHLEACGIEGPLRIRVVFEPAMVAGGALTHSFAWLVGTGPGAGMGLMFVLTGAIILFVGVTAYAIPAIRNVETLLPDHEQVENPAQHTLDQAGAAPGRAPLAPAPPFRTGVVVPSPASAGHVSWPCPLPGLPCPQADYPPWADLWRRRGLLVMPEF